MNQLDFLMEMVQQDFIEPVSEMGDTYSSDKWNKLAVAAGNREYAERKKNAERKKAGMFEDDIANSNRIIKKDEAAKQKFRERRDREHHNEVLRAMDKPPLQSWYKKKGFKTAN